MHIEPTAPFRLSKYEHHAKARLDPRTGKNITVLSDVDDEVKIFSRVATKPFADHIADEVWSVAKVGDLFVYVNGDHIVITRRDMVATSRPQGWDLPQALARLGKVTAGMDADLEAAGGTFSDEPGAAQ